MKVLIAAAQFSSELSGVQRHALNLVKSLLCRSTVTEVHVVIAPWQAQFAQHGALRSARVKVHVAIMNRGLVSRNAWYYWQLPHLIRRIRPDIVHLSYPVPIDRCSIEPPVALTLHDMYPFDIPENFGFPKAMFNRTMLRRCLTTAGAIACVSDATLDRLRHYLSSGIYKKALRIYNCVEPSTYCTGDSPIPNWKGEPFLLSVSQHRKNKNLILLIETFNTLLRRRSIAPDTQLVVVGISGPETSHLVQKICRLDIRRQVHLLQGLAEGELQWCYRNCEAAVAPSIIEGFGLPVAEALFAGCRVVCSDIPAFREIASHHCKFVSLGPDSPDRFAEAIASTMAEPRPKPIKLPQFSAHAVGQQYVELYCNLLSISSTIKRAANPFPRAMSARGAESWQAQGEKLDAI